MSRQLEETKLLKNNREPKLFGQDRISFKLNLTKNLNIFSPSHTPIWMDFCIWAMHFLWQNVISSLGTNVYVAIMFFFLLDSIVLECLFVQQQINSLMNYKNMETLQNFLKMSHLQAFNTTYWRWCIFKKNRSQNLKTQNIGFHISRN